MASGDNAEGTPLRPSAQEEEGRTSTARLQANEEDKSGGDSSERGILAWECGAGL